MQINKITNSFLKKIRKGDRAFLEHSKDGYYVISDGYVLYKIEDSQMELNPDRFQYRENTLDILNNALKKEREIVSKISYIKRYNKLVAVLESENNKTYVDDIFLECFQFPSYYIASSPVEAVIVKESDDVVGLVMPIRVVD